MRLVQVLRRWPRVIIQSAIRWLWCIVLLSLWLFYVLLLQLSGIVTLTLIALAILQHWLGQVVKAFGRALFAWCSHLWIGCQSAQFGSDPCRCGWVLCVVAQSTRHSGLLIDPLLTQVRLRRGFVHDSTMAFASYGWNWVDPGSWSAFGWHGYSRSVPLIDAFNMSQIHGFSQEVMLLLSFCQSMVEQFWCSLLTLWYLGLDIKRCLCISHWS